MKKIIGITGSNGVLGKYFIKKYKNYKFDLFQGDITNKKDVYNWVAKTKCTHIIHFASKVSTNYVKKNFKYSLKVNYYGTKNLIDNIIESKKKIWFFFASSSHVYKISNKKLKENDILKPLTPYGKTKYEAEKYLLKKLRKNSSRICIGRIFSYTHKSQTLPYLVPSIFEKLRKKNKKIIFKNLNHERDFSHIDDICRAINLLKKKNITGIYNIASGNSVKLYDLAKMINKNKKLIFHKENKLKTKLIANISKIKKIGFEPRYGINKIVSDFIKKK